VVLSVVLARAFFAAGYEVQTFPVFGVERRGAPVEAYLRLDDRKIRIRSNVYTPDHVVVQDVRLLKTVDVTRGLKPGGWVLINARCVIEDSRFAGFRLAVVDATRIAQGLRLGTATQPIINTAMIGAFARMMDAPPLHAIETAIGREIPARQEENIAAARQAYDAVVLPR